MAGTGKSTIAQTVARQYNDQNRLAGSFFFSRGGGDTGHAGKFVTSIATQLAYNIPSVQQHICEAIEEQKNIISQSLQDQWRQLIFKALSKVQGNFSQSYIVVVDALDECNNADDIELILRLLAEARSVNTVKLRFFVTSRPEISIRNSFQRMSDSEHYDFVLHHISPPVIDHDIRIFLKHNLHNIALERSLEPGWPGEETIDRLVGNAKGLFIWASTACRFIRNGTRFAKKRLAMLLEPSSPSISEPEKHLDEMYTTVLRQCVSPDYLDEEREEMCTMIKCILGSIVVLYSPLSADSISKLLQIQKPDVIGALEELHSILDIPNEQTRPIRLHHPSFRDFLLHEERCGDLNFWVAEKEAHKILVNDCIQIMSAFLKENICGVKIPGAFVEDVEITQLEQCLPMEIQYACLYWAQHLQKSDAQFHDNDIIHDFLQTHLLHWLEALGWMQRLSEGIVAINALEYMVSVSSYLLASRTLLTSYSDPPLPRFTCVHPRCQTIYPQ